MAQFDIYTNTDKDTNLAYPYFVDIQSSLLEALNSRVVIPLTPTNKSDKNYPTDLCPEVIINNKRYSLLTHQLTSINSPFLKQREGSLSECRNDIVAAIDFLVTGI